MRKQGIKKERILRFEFITRIIRMEFQILRKFSTLWNSKVEEWQNIMEDETSDTMLQVLDRSENKENPYHLLHFLNRNSLMFSTTLYPYTSNCVLNRLFWQVLCLNKTSMLSSNWGDISHVTSKIIWFLSNHKPTILMPKTRDHCHWPLTNLSELKFCCNQLSIPLLKNEHQWSFSIHCSYFSLQPHPMY